MTVAHLLAFSFFYIKSTTTSLLSCFAPADVHVLKISLNIIFKSATLCLHSFLLADFPTHMFTAYVFQFPVHIMCPPHFILIYWNILTTFGGCILRDYLNLSYYVLDQRHFHTFTLLEQIKNFTFILRKISALEFSSGRLQHTRLLP